MTMPKIRGDSFENFRESMVTAAGSDYFCEKYPNVAQAVGKNVGTVLLGLPRHNPMEFQRQIKLHIAYAKADHSLGHPHEREEFDAKAELYTEILAGLQDAEWLSVAAPVMQVGKTVVRNPLTGLNA